MVLSGSSLQRPFARAVLTIFCLGLLVSLRAAEPGGIAGTMPEDYLPELKPILAQAMLRAPDVIVKDFERLSSEARLLEANASRLPRLGGNFNYAATQTATSADASAKTRDNGLFYNFGLSQELFHWGALKNERAGARLGVLVAERNVALVYRTVCVTIRKAYLALVVEKALLREKQQALELLRREVEIMEIKKTQGSIAASVLEGGKLRLREGALAVNRARSDFTTNRDRLKRLAGLSDLPEEAIADDIPRPVYDEQKTVDLAAEVLRDNAKSTLEGEVYEMKLRQAVLNQKIQSVRQLPKFGASASYNLENTNNVNAAGIVEQKAISRQTLGVGGSWDIFDGFRTRAAKQSALIGKRALERQMAADMEQIMQETQALERTLRLDAELVDVADVNRNIAAQGHKRILDEVGLGKLPRNEAARAEVAVLQANAKTLESRAAFLTHWSEFVAITGGDPVLNNLPGHYVRGKK